MSFLSSVFNEILFRPLFNFLVAIYDLIPDFGIAVILLTVIIRLILYPLSIKALKSQKTLAELQPKIKAIQSQYTNDRERQAREMMNFYKEQKISPFSGCLPILIQLPILLALYQVFISGLDPERLNNLYAFIPNPGIIDGKFLNLVDLAIPSLIFALLAGIFQFLQSYYMLKIQPPTIGRPDMAKAMSWQMTFFLPVLTVLISMRFPAGLPLYWITTNIFSIIQQWYIFRKKSGSGGGQ